MSEGSNRLPVLAAQVTKAHKNVGIFAGMAAVEALAAGAALVEAKEICGHGNWAPWLQSTGISERSAQRYMLMHRAGLKPAIVADLGFAAAERYAGLGMKLLPAEAEHKPADRDAFRQLHLNQWLDYSETPFVEMAIYDEGDAEIDLDDMEASQAPCWLDLRASTHHHDPIFTPIFTSILGSSLFGFTGAALTNAVAIASALATTSITKGLQRT